MQQPDREEMRALAGKLAEQLPADTDERRWAALIAEGKMPYNEVVYHFRRVALHVRDSKSHRLSKPVRAACLGWLAAYGGRLRSGPIRGARRLEMRLTDSEYEVIKRKADKAGLSMAEYARYRTLLDAEKD